MKYPNFLRKGDCIGVCAPSLGCTRIAYIARANNAKAVFKAKGYEVVFTPHAFKNSLGASCPAKIRAKEFLDLWQDEKIDFISSIGGGELMLEILEHINFEQLTNHPIKYFMGYSDNTFLSFTLPTICDIATIYSHNFTNFGTSSWHRETRDCYRLITGKKFIQKSYSRYESPNRPTKDKPLEPIHGTKNVIWKTLYNENIIEIEGRMIGGCLDCLVHLVGTPYDKVKEFSEKYQDEGIIFFLESCDLTVFGIVRALTQLRLAGWFKHCKGIIFGRPLNNKGFLGLDYKQALLSSLESLNIKVIYDADFGHVAPRMSIINGGYAKITYSNNKGALATILK